MRGQPLGQGVNGIIYVYLSKPEVWPQEPNN